MSRKGGGPGIPPNPWNALVANSKWLPPKVIGMPLVCGLQSGERWGRTEVCANSASKRRSSTGIGATGSGACLTDRLETLKIGLPVKDFYRGQPINTIRALSANFGTTFLATLSLRTADRARQPPPSISDESGQT